MKGSILLACCLAGIPASGFAAGPLPAPVMLANIYAASGVDLSEYWVSEKYDGVRAYWDGQRLLTRSGHVLQAPGWFTADWPQVPLDGELWLGRGQFETISATVRDTNPDPAAWRRIRFMVFDLPAHPGTFTERLAALEALLPELPIPWVQRVTQLRISDRTALEKELQKVVAAGGEGLMLHRGHSFYRAERNDDLLKLKPRQDAEAQVVEHLPGKGKYEGMLGALQVQRADGLQFRLGTGFTDEQRRHPPPLGSWVTYSYQSLTAKGVPRFARFVRKRDEVTK